MTGSWPPHSRRQSRTPCSTQPTKQPRDLAAVQLTQPLRQQHQLPLTEPPAMNGQLLDHSHGSRIERRDRRLADGVDEADLARLLRIEDLVAEKETAGGGGID